MPLRLVTHLLRVVSLPHWGAHRLRTALTIVGVSLGVMTVVGIADVSESVLASFHHMVATVAGDAELEVTSDVGSVDETLIERVRQVPGVRDAAGIVEAFVPLAGHEGETLYLLGMDFLGSPVWEKQFPRQSIAIDDELAFIAQLDSIALPVDFIARHGLGEGSELRVLTPVGPRALRPRGRLAGGAIARLFDGAVGAMDLPAAQRLLAREGRVDRIAVMLAGGAPAEHVQARLRAALGPDVTVAVPAERGQQSERLLYALRVILALMSFGAAIVGTFIVYHTVSVSVQQRRREFALLRTVGVARPALVALCLVEIVALALPGVLLGFGGGWVLARLAAHLVGETASEIWLRVGASEHAHSVGGALAGLVVGVAVPIATAYVAARATFEMPTIEALRPAHLWFGSPPRRARALLVGLLLLGGAWLIVLAPRSLGFAATVAAILATHTMAYAGAAVPAPALVSLVGSGLGRVGRHLPSLPARLATENLPRAPARSGATVATITAALGIATVVSGFVGSFEAAWVRWVDEHFAADLLVGTGGRVRLFAGAPMRAAVADVLAGTPGVADVEPFRVLPIRLQGQPVFLQGLSLDGRARKPQMVEGSLPAAAPLLRAGSGVLVSDNLAYRLGLHRGDVVDLPTPSGLRRFTVEGTFVDYLGSLDLGAVVVEQRHLRAIWHDELANLFRVSLEPGASPSVVRAAMLRKLGPSGGYYVLTAGEFVGGIQAALGQFFRATWALQIIASLVGVIGILNAQLAEVLDRAADIRLLRTIGVAGRDIVRSVMLECGALGALGGACGVLLGSMLSAQVVTSALRLVTGWQIPFVLPVESLAVAVASATLVSALAGYVPARAAAAVKPAYQGVD